MKTPRLRSCQHAIVVACVMGANVLPARAQVTFRVIRAFNELQAPAGLTEGAPGILYFTTLDGANGSVGFSSITTQGTMTVLGSLSSGHNFLGPVVSGPDGRFYDGVEQSLEPATLVSVGAAPGSLRVDPPQPLGFTPAQNMPDEELLCTAATLSSSPSWYLAKCDLKGGITTIYSFPSNESLPPSSTIYGSDGNFYGVSMVIQDGSGYVYRVSSAGVLTKLWTFSGGTFIWGYNVPLLEATDGNLYGATAGPSVNGPGTIYKLTLEGQYTLLHTFPACPDCIPTTLIEGSDGNLYGATDGNAYYDYSGKLFRITTSGEYTLLNGNFAGICHCQLVQGSDGVIYGAAIEGARYAGGDIFALDAGLPVPAPRAQRFNPPSGAVGTRVLIWGANLLSASVMFNGVPASSVTNSGPNYVIAAVPVGAASGPITVTTPGGASTTTTSFTVE